MRELLCLAMARRMGQTITKDTAVEILRDLFPDRSYDPKQFGQQDYKGYTFRCERLSEILPELHPLHEAHYAETEKYRRGIPLNMHYEALKDSERAGGLLQFTARRTDTGELVGNMRIFVGRSLHTQTLFTTEDTFYVVPEHRGGFMAVRLWQFAERAGLSIGIKEARFSSKLVNKADKMAKYLKYEPVATQFVKFAD
ncbi:hypothetical protein [Polaromonas sp.]|uniref:hypothetical protein n=1 Tax=Polaromonas sp. TaxID=1869339 RepID=UPI003263EBF8